MNKEWKRNSERQKPKSKPLRKTPLRCWEGETEDKKVKPTYSFPAAGLEEQTQTGVRRGKQTRWRRPLLPELGRCWDDSGLGARTAAGGARKTTQALPPPRPGSSPSALPVARDAQVDSLTSTSRQLPGTKWIESSFSRPTMPAVFAPQPQRPPLPPAQDRHGPQLPRPRPASLGPGRPPVHCFRLPPPRPRPVIGHIPWMPPKGAGQRPVRSQPTPQLLKGYTKQRPWP